MWRSEHRPGHTTRFYRPSFMRPDPVPVSSLLNSTLQTIDQELPSRVPSPISPYAKQLPRNCLTMSKRNQNVFLDPTGMYRRPRSNHCYHRVPLSASSSFRSGRRRDCASISSSSASWPGGRREGAGGGDEGGVRRMSRPGPATTNIL